MDIINLTNFNKNLDTNKYVFDATSYNDKLVKFEINPRQNVSLLFLNINNELTIEFKAHESSNIKVSFLQLKPCKLSINGELFANSNAVFYFADFATRNIDLDTNIDLVGENANCDWNLASLTKDKDQKEFNVSIYHKSKKTFCNINNYGVARDKSKLIFSGICKIENGCKESIAHQNSKIMVFDEESDAIAKPILKIDENNIQASHAAVVGKISDDHLFYLTSRGLSPEEARKLITYGYLKPILNGFDDEKLQEEISNMIEGGI